MNCPKCGGVSPSENTTCPQCCERCASPAGCVSDTTANPIHPVALIAIVILLVVGLVAINNYSEKEPQHESTESQLNLHDTATKRFLFNSSDRPFSLDSFSPPASVIENATHAGDPAMIPLRPERLRKLQDLGNSDETMRRMKEVREEKAEPTRHQSELGKFLNPTPSP